MKFKTKMYDSTRLTDLPVRLPVYKCSTSDGCKSSKLGWILSPHLTIVKVLLYMDGATKIKFGWLCRYIHELNYPQQQVFTIVCTQHTEKVLVNVSIENTPLTSFVRSFWRSVNSRTLNFFGSCTQNTSFCTRPFPQPKLTTQDLHTKNYTAHTYCCQRIGCK